MNTQFGGGSSPSSSSSINRQSSQNQLNVQNRKPASIVNVGSLKKRTAPAPPPTNSIQTIYSTLPHAPRHPPSLDLNDINKNSTDIYSTLPHSRNSDSKNSSFHYDNKMYERFEPLMNSTTQQVKFEKNRYDNESSNVTQLTTFTGGQTHKRSPSGDSIGRNLHLGKYFGLF